MLSRLAGQAGWGRAPRRRRFPKERITGLKHCGQKQEALDAQLAVAKNRLFFVVIFTDLFFEANFCVWSLEK